MSLPSSAPVRISPDAIFAGLGLADRRALCGLLATMEAASALSIAEGALLEIRRRFDKDVAGAAARLAARAEALDRSAETTDALRLQLWRAMAGSLEVGKREAPPLSPRDAQREAAGLALRAVEALAPTLSEDDAAEGWRERVQARMQSAADRLRGLIRGGSAAQDAAPQLSFPDVVADEARRMLDSLDPASFDGFDKETAAALRDGRRAMQGLAVAGGGWAAVAATVGGAGFAPYILAAQASAFIPFVGGPALVSFLAVMTNPFTLLAGAGALLWAGRGKARAVQAVAAARAAVMLALSGMGLEREGLGEFVSALRRASRNDADAWPRLRRIEARIGRPLPDASGTPPEDWNRAVPASAGAPDAEADLAAAMMTGGLTAADMLHHAACIDPNVLAAADFSRVADISDPLAFAVHAADFASRGAEIALRGYTAERVVLARLIEDGHDAILAPDSATPGFDLIVDGAPVQVKCGLSLDLLKEHFHKYPDIPVIADAGLAAQAAQSSADWAYMVTTVEGFDLDVVEAMTQRTLDAAEGLVAPDLVLAALSVGAARGAWQVWRGAIPLADLPAWMALDMLARGGLAAAGAKVGAFAGLLVVGPAGAVILGPAVGAAAQFGAGHAREMLERVVRTQWHAEMLAAAARLHDTLAHATERRVGALSARAIARAMGGEGTILGWLSDRATDDAVFAASLLEDMDKAPGDESRARALLLIARREAPTDAAVLAAGDALRRSFAARPGLLEALERGTADLRHQLRRTADR